MDNELLAMPYEVNYISTTCPGCSCVLSIPQSVTSWIVKSWVCPKCGQLYSIDLTVGYWTEDKVILALDGNRFIEQQVFSAQKRLDRLLKAYDDIGIEFTNGSLTGEKNDLIIVQVFTTRTCEEGTDIWTGVEDDIATLLIRIGQSIGMIEKAIEEKDG